MEDELKDMIVLDGFDECIIGVVSMFGSGPRVCYDKEQILTALMCDGEMEYVEAEEYFEFNIIGGYFGEQNPVFLTKQDVFTEYE